MGFIIELKEKSIVIDLGVSFRYDNWVKDYPVIQKTLDSGMFVGVSFKKIIVDISKCTWVDPLPLLSLLISFNECHKNGKLIELIVADITTDRRETDKVINFLHSEGFLLEFSKCAAVISRYGEIVFDKQSQGYVNHELLKSYSKINSSLYYTNSSVLPALIIDTKKQFRTELDHIDKWIDDLIHKIKPQLRDKIPSFSQNAVIHRLTIVLVEMISNVVKHAYENSDKTFAGVYIRFRNGLDNNSLSIDERKKLNKALREEEKHCSRLKREYLDVRKGCLEIFVIDAGVGFTESLNAGLGKAYRYPFREAYNRVFVDAQRKKGPETPDRTYEGGLFYIGQMFLANQDYVFGRDDNEWVGGSLPLDGDAAEVTNKSGDDHLLGLSWIVRLSWKNETEIGKGKWKSWDGQIQENPVYDELKNNLTIPTDQYKIFDFRFPKDQLPVFKSAANEDDVVLLLPNPYQTKYGIWNKLRSLAATLDDTDNRTLIIADIPEYEKQIYLYALEKITITNYEFNFWINRFSEIILVSNRLSVAVLVKFNATFIYSEELSFQYLERSDNEEWQPNQSLPHLIRWLRNYDSILFWLNIKKLNFTSNYYLNAEIYWNEAVGEIIGYLDFAQSCTDAFNLKIYRNALERVLGIFGESFENNSTPCKFVNMDVLTKRIVDEANGTFFNDTKKGQLDLKVYVGSVFVSGESKQDAMFYLDEQNDRRIINVHFFQHDFSKATTAHLLNWPKQNWLVQFEKFPNKFKRVGKTHIIAEHGYKSFPMPRFYEDGSSAYFRNPRKTYNDWQDEKNQIISLGHFEFEGKHDLLKINLLKVIEESFLLGLDLAKFLISEFFIALGGKTEKELRGRGKKEFAYIRKRLEAIDGDLEDAIGTVDIIVYPTNSNAAFVIEKIKEVLSPDLTKKIFALMPVNKERVGSTLLISPLVISTIKELLQKSEDKRVMLFDTSIISGRTRKELKHLLQGLGAKEVKMLSITDRYRLPLHVPEKTRHKAYWRLDVPRLGTSDMCPICKSLEILTNFKDSLASNIAVKRIDDIVANWKAISNFDPISDHGIKPTPITVTEKKMGIRFDSHSNTFHQIISTKDREENVKNHIVLRNSLGLSIYVSELHAMTSRDDLAIKMIHRMTDLSDVAKIELICSQLLLFPNEYSKKVQFDMVIELFTACNKINQSDNWTALGVLVLLIQSKELHQRLIDKVHVQGTKELKVQNLDLNIVIAYILKNSGVSDPDVAEKIFRLLKYTGEDKLADIYKQFHYEIYNDAGAIHSKPLIAFYLKNEIVEQERLEDAINSISKLIFLLDKIQSWQLKKKPKNLNSTSAQRNQSRFLLNQFYDRFAAILPVQATIDAMHTIDAGYTQKFTALQNDVRAELVPNLQNLHSHLFCSMMPTQECGTIRNEVTEAIKNISAVEWEYEAKNKNEHFITKPPVVALSNYADYQPVYLTAKRRNYWIICDQIIQSELKYTIMNAIHSTGPIRDVWSLDADDKTLADLWINISYFEENVVIMFANRSAESAEEIYQNIVQKNKEGLLHLKDDLGGKFLVESHSSSIDGNIIIVKLVIPLI